MSWVCELTGKRRLKGNLISHSNIKTRKFSLPNLVRRKWYITELDRSVTVRLSTSGLKVINARGDLGRAILMEKDENLSERLLRLKKDIIAVHKKGGPKKTAKKAAEPQDQAVTKEAPESH